MHSNEVNKTAKIAWQRINNINALLLIPPSTIIHNNIIYRIHIASNQ
jgi:hypothetical protein